jgi:tryptophan synthase beta chain
MSTPSRSDTKFLLGESDMPPAWYNILADLPEPMSPPLHPGTGQPAGPDDLAPLFPMDLILQEVSTDRFIDIPQEVQDIYKLWRPTPLYRAHRLEKLLDTPAKIFYKYEGTSPAGSHKPNTAVAQAFYNKAAGINRLTTETGAGQWGSALAMSAAFFDMEVKVFMVRVSYEQKPYRRALMQAWGATCIPSPSNETEAGRRILQQEPDSRGSLGIAISEAVEEAVTRDDTHYALGSVLNHVMLHQTVIGQEAQKQFELADTYPDVIFGCVGGGSNFGGLVLPFVKDRIDGKDLRIVAVEPTACPTLTRGSFVYDFGDTAQTTPLMKMHSLGHTFMPAGIHAGGLRYHGMSPIVSHLYEHKLIEAIALPQTAIFEAAIQFARSEGIVPAPESAHAVRAGIDEALRCKEAGEDKTILIGLSGHGNFDMGAYEDYFAGNLIDHEHPQDDIDRALAQLPVVGS